jgi:magnesium transporter
VPPVIRSFVFSQTQGRLLAQDIDLGLLSVFRQDEGVQFWIDAGECTDAEVKAVLDGVFHFHPLAIEDCLTPSDRPKADEYEGYVFMIIHAVDYNAHEFKTTELNMFIGKDFLVTFHREPLRCVNSTIERIQKNAPAVARAPDRLTYTILNHILDGYDPALEELATDIADLEKSMLERPATNIAPEVMRLKNEVQRLRQIASPQRDVIQRLARGEFTKVVRAPMLPYYRDLLDHLVRITTRTDNYRDALTNTLQVHLNLQQMEVNRVIKVLTVLATLSMPLLVLTSFYGMNFNHWPSMESAWAYPWVFGTTVASTGLLYWLLKRKGWW